MSRRSSGAAGGSGGPGYGYHSPRRQQPYTSGTVPQYRPDASPRHRPADLQTGNDDDGGGDGDAAGMQSPQQFLSEHTGGGGSSAGAAHADAYYPQEPDRYPAGRVEDAPPAQEPAAGSGMGSGSFGLIGAAVILAAVLYALLTTGGSDSALLRNASVLSALSGSGGASNGRAGGSAATGTLAGESLEAELATTRSRLDAILSDTEPDRAARALADSSARGETGAERERKLVDAHAAAHADDTATALAAYRSVRSLGEALEQTSARKEQLVTALRARVKALTTHHANAQYAVDQYLKQRSAGLSGPRDDLDAARRELSAQQSAARAAEQKLADFGATVTHRDAALERLRDRVTGSEVSATDARDKLVHQRSVVANLRASLSACDATHAQYAPTLARLVAERDALDDRRQQLTAAHSSAQAKLQQQKARVAKLTSASATLVHVRDVLEQLAAIGGKVGSVRDLLTTQRAELDRLHAAAQSASTVAPPGGAAVGSGDGSDAAGAGVASTAAEGAGDTADDDPLLAQALAISERVKARTIADAKRNIEVLEALSTGLSSENVDLQTYRAQLTERVASDRTAIDAAASDLASTERELADAAAAVGALQSRVDSVNSELSAAHKLDADQKRCKTDTTQQLQLSEEFLKALDDDVKRRTKLLADATDALRAEEATRATSDSAESDLRAAIDAARGRARTAEADVAKKLQLLQFRIDALADARKAADTALRTLRATETALSDEQTAVGVVQTDIRGLLTELARKLAPPKLQQQ